MKQHHPEAEISAGNRWYVADQFRSQLGSRGRRRVIEYRWEVFTAFLRDWRERRGHIGRLNILDAGCGDGINLLGLDEMTAGQNPRASICGLDYNPVRLARARSVAGGSRLQQGSLYDLPFVGDSFDVVLCNHVIEHVPDLSRALSELHRVVRPGGLLVVGVPNEGCLMGRMRNRLVQPSIGRTTDHVHFFTAQTLGDALRRAGFRVQRIERETFFFPCSYANACCAEFGIGHRLMAGLRALLPSQAGGLIVAAEKPAHV
jgi:ubiquinone/menaquinone biosynthesis C-methylase UbiE